jgi:hypothetical protein
VGPGCGQFHQVAPPIGARARPGKEFVDTHGLTICFPTHVAVPSRQQPASSRMGQAGAMANTLLRVINHGVG